MENRIDNNENLDYEYIKNLKLGAIYSKEKTIFRVFAKNRENIDLLITDDYRKSRKRKYKMKKNKFGFFETAILGDLDNMYYSFLVDNKYESTDPYSKSSSINSIMSAVVDLKKTDPIGFRESGYCRIPENEALIYELNIKDFTSNKNTNVKNRGKFLGLSEENSNYNGLKTSLSHLKELGITHIQILPFYDFISVKEENEYFFDDDNYNWGYDPELYFNVEGSYSTNPFDPKNRIFELKTMIKKIHENGMGVIMDVVFNHTFKTKDSNFEILAPGYYYRKNYDGTFSNGSGVGNEFCSDNFLGRKLIIDALKYWTKEYKIDGFRFDLMALIDIDTIVEALKEVKKINKNTFFYGEPWMGGISVLNFDKQILPSRQMGKSFALFNSDFRDAIKGDNDGYTSGYIQGNFSTKKAVEVGISGSINYDENRIGFCRNANETINYFNSHDNLILNDKLNISLNDTSKVIDITKLAFSIIYLSFGKALIYEGNEFMHSKKNVSNSYKSPLSINSIDWSLKEKNFSLFKYVKDLISLRKELQVFSEIESEKIRQILKFIEIKDSLLTYYIKRKNDTVLIAINVADNFEILKRDFLEGIMKLKNIKINKVFSKNGKIDEEIINDLYLENKSTNIYLIGEKNGL
ncbi:MAG: type I pullulanase [Peptoniphilaceae bacterium]|nr:type I pullulanase [Peptoniphilaceae bacterium]